MNNSPQTDHHASQEDACCKNEKKGGFLARMFQGGKKCCKEHTDEKEMNGQCCRSKKAGTRNDVVNAARIMLGLMEKQIEGMSAQELVQQPGGVKNHPVWTMGHIALTLNGMVQWMGGTSAFDQEKWGKLFGGGSQPVADAKAYPSPQELMQTVQKLYAQASEMYLKAPSEVLRGPNPRAEIMPMCTTLGSMVVFLMSAHMSEHIGQISAWRRAMGKNPLF